MSERRSKYLLTDTNMFFASINFINPVLRIFVFYVDRVYTLEPTVFGWLGVFFRVLLIKGKNFSVALISQLFQPPLNWVATVEYILQ